MHFFKSTTFKQIRHQDKHLTKAEKMCKKQQMREKYKLIIIKKTSIDQIEVILGFLINSFVSRHFIYSS